MRVLALVLTAASLFGTSCATPGPRKHKLTAERIQTKAEEFCSEETSPGEPRWKLYGSFASCVQIAVDAKNASLTRKAQARERQDRADASEEEASMPKAYAPPKQTKCRTKNVLGTLQTDCTSTP